MGLLADVFSGDAFRMVNMTTALTLLPQIPTKLGDMGLFTDDPQLTNTVTVEEQDGILTILQTQPRGTRGNELRRPRRKMRAFAIPHIPEFDSIKAEDLIGVREFGAGPVDYSGTGGVDDVTNLEQQLRTWATAINNKQQLMKNNIIATWEWHRASAIQGLTKDADGSTIYDWFAEFGVTQQSFPFDFTVSPTVDVKVNSQKVCRAMQFALGNTPFTGIQVICGDNFWDAFISSPTVKEAYKNWSNTFLQTQQRNGFMFADMYWMNYTAKLNGTDLVPTESARAIPLGVPGLFKQCNGPGNFVECVGTKGLPMYSKQRVDEWETAVELFMQSNPLFMATRPGALLQITHT